MTSLRTPLAALLLVSSAAFPLVAQEMPKSIAVTAGWLTITAATENTAIARIDFACDGIQAGDYLEPFSAPTPATC